MSPGSIRQSSVHVLWLHVKCLPTSRATIPVTAGAVAVSGTILLKSTGSGLSLGLKPSITAYMILGRLSLYASVSWSVKWSF